MGKNERITLEKGCVSKRDTALLFLFKVWYMNKLTLISPAFSPGSNIPEKYSCKGKNINPPIDIQSIPPETVSLAIVVEDPDAPSGVFDHWVAWNLPPFKQIPENYKVGVQGKNGKGKTGYTGPCPPSGTHHYQFKIYALDMMFDLPVGTNKSDLLNRIQDHVIATGELTGKFSAPSTVTT
jgi:Raf kinase inhibitor-like YbhB/YbcL family protein